MEDLNDVSNIPANSLVTMTEFLHRTFNAAGCGPMCHCCQKMITVETSFQLATVKEAPATWGTGLRGRFG